MQYFTKVHFNELIQTGITNKFGPGGDHSLYFAGLNVPDMKGQLQAKKSSS